jgi:hypothetical protein
MAQAPEAEPAERGQRRQDPARAQTRQRAHRRLEERMASTLNDRLRRIVEGEDVLRAGGHGEGQE